jgi:hypothetical protein
VRSILFDRSLPAIVNFTLAPGTYFRYWAVCLLVLASLLSVAKANEKGQMIVSYDFEHALAEVGPDTYQIFKHTYGKVGLSQAYKYSGWRSLKIQDVAGDGGFPELQGYFNTVTSGKLHFHFAFMVVEVNERFNIALAGKSHFRLRKHGIGFWLENEAGRLRHYVDGEPVELFALDPFVWYQLDLVYDVDQGQYALTIENEFGQRLVELEASANAVNMPGSTLNMFSFIGDLEDQQNASYYVDDVILYSQQSSAPADFVAPGRRKLFVDIWNDYHQALYGKIQCLPAVQSMDLGVDFDVFTDLMATDHYDTLTKLLANQQVEPGDWQSNPYLQAIDLWRKGCSNLSSKNWQQAIAEFDEASQLISSARMYRLSLALAYAGAGDYVRSDALLASIQSEWVNEPRLSVAYAMVGISRDDLDSATQWLTQSALGAWEDGMPELFEGLYSDSINANVIAQLQLFDPDNWPELLEQAVITEQYYFAQLWQKNYYEAYLCARNMTTRLQEQGFVSAKWQERTADAAFYNQDYEEAIVYYEAALTNDNACYCNYLKLADVFHIKGDSTREREYREMIYGKFENVD